MAKVTGLAHIGIIVSDMDRSLNFYRDTLGFVLDESVTLGNGTQLAFLHVGPCIIELICRTDRLVPEKPGPVDHVCLDVEGIEELVETLRGKGVQFLGDINAMSGGLAGIKNIFFTGPDGERIELFDQTGRA